MPHPVAGAARHESLLLSVLRTPDTVRGFRSGDWELLVRVARSAELLGRVGARLDTADLRGEIPPAAWAHLESALVEARYRAQMVAAELARLERALGPLGTPLVLLKGAAYLAERRPWAAGRLPADVDLMVPRSRLDEAERALRASGWTMAPLHPYDERYYREWSHELPPMRYPGHANELDLHHTILPRTGRLRPDADALASRSVPIASGPFRALAPPDQVLHLCAHLFQESDCANRLRDIVDLDAMLRDFGAQESFWRELPQHAARHQLARPLWYGLRFAERFLGTPIPASARAALAAGKPGPVARASMDLLVPLAMLPTDPDRRTPIGARLARATLLARSHWLRMPPLLLVRHLAHKSMRRWMPQPKGTTGAQGA